MKSAMLWWAGANTSVYDVASGIAYGLEADGIDLTHYHTDNRIVASGRYLHSVWRRQNRLRKQQGRELLPKPQPLDAIRHACDQAAVRAWRRKVEWVICVSGLWMDPDMLPLMRQMGIKVALVCTESPYETDWELHLARHADHVWTNERTCVDVFRSACPSVAYLRHAWHPEIHTFGAAEEDVPAHDVVFVGTGFPERIALLEGIDWSGLDVGLYGFWDDVPDDSPLKPLVRPGAVPNARTAALYRRAQIGINLHRTSAFKRGDEPTRYVTGAESLNPRAYELAACGRFFVSDYRPEVDDVFGATLPTFATAAEAESLIRHWLTDRQGREVRGQQLREAVARESWRERGQQMVRDLRAVAARSEAA